MFHSPSSSTQSGPRSVLSAKRAGVKLLRVWLTVWPAVTVPVKMASAARHRPRPHRKIFPVGLAGTDSHLPLREDKPNNRRDENCPIVLRKE